MFSCFLILSYILAGLNLHIRSFDISLLPCQNTNKFASITMHAILDISMTWTMGKWYVEFELRSAQLSRCNLTRIFASKLDVDRTDDLNNEIITDTPQTFQMQAPVFFASQLVQVSASATSSADTFLPYAADVPTSDRIVCSTITTSHT